jgi:hypothetical protein
MSTIISVVIPVYNEQSNIVLFLTRTVNDLNKINLKYKFPISYNNKDKYIFLPNQCYIRIK